MPLNWSLQSVDYYKENPDKIWVKHNQFGFETEDVNPEAKALIFGMMSIGLSGITETNVAEFYGRWKVIEIVDGAYVTAMVVEGGDLEKTYMSPQIANKYIGLSTNTSKLSLTNWARLFTRQTDKYKIADIKSIVNFYSLEYREEMGLL